MEQFKLTLHPQHFSTLQSSSLVILPPLDLCDRSLLLDGATQTANSTSKRKKVANKLVEKRTGTKEENTKASDKTEMVDKMSMAELDYQSKNGAEVRHRPVSITITIVSHSFGKRPAAQAEPDLVSVEKRNFQTHYHRIG